jgi:hypothetical protein
MSETSGKALFGNNFAIIEKGIVIKEQQLLFLLVY